MKMLHLAIRLAKRCFKEMTERLPIFIREILAQSHILGASVASWDRTQFMEAATLIRNKRRIILTGMGASFVALLPAWRHLVGAGFSAWHIDTAELLSVGDGLICSDSVIVAASQSGRSVELLLLAERLRDDISLLAISNELTSPLARSSGSAIGLHSGEEKGVSTKSYLNTLAVSTVLALIASTSVNGKDSWAQLLTDWHRAAEAIDIYLQHWRRAVDLFKEKIRLPERGVLLGRGSSLAAAMYGALIIKEAAKWPIEAISCSQFRHGPLEIVDARLTALVFAGGDETALERNRKLASDIIGYGGKLCWLDTQQQIGGALNIVLPKVAPPALPLIEVLPVQLLSVALAELTGIEPGAFRHLEKVTTVE